MRWRQLVQVCLAAAAIVGAATLAQAQDATDGGKLKVTIDYKGAGAVDAEHRVWVWVFDTPNISADVMPLAIGVIKENKASYKFVGLPKQVYLAAAFDNLGGYDGSMAPPPSGTPLTIHGAMGPGQPGAVVATGGDDASVTVTFDDSVKMP
jgi:uncharacterized protein (DUF2141 family)